MFVKNSPLLSTALCLSLLLFASCGTERVETTYDRPDGVSAFLGIRFQIADVDKDGHLSYVEYLGLPVARQANRDEIFETADVNKDNYISKPEAQLYVRTHFKNGKK